MLPGFRQRFLKARPTARRAISTRERLLRLFSYLLVIVICHTACMIWLEGLRLDQAIWLTLTTVTTVGYGDISAQTLPGRIATVLLLYVGGIALLAQVAAVYFETRTEQRIRMLTGDWSPKMRNHIVFLNSRQEVDEPYFYRAMQVLRSSESELSGLPVVLVCDLFKDGLSKRLRELDVVHVAKPPTENATLEAASVSKAHTIVCLSPDRMSPVSDSINFELIDRLRQQGVKARIIAEAVKDENRARLMQAGADNVLRPIRAYPELLIRSILAPGAEQVIETLFDSNGEECIRYEVQTRQTWLDILMKIAREGGGTAIAYEDRSGHVVNNPPADVTVETRAIFVIVRQGAIKSHYAVEEMLNAQLNAPT